MSESSLSVQGLQSDRAALCSSAPGFLRVAAGKGICFLSCQLSLAFHSYPALDRLRPYHSLPPISRSPPFLRPETAFLSPPPPLPRPEPGARFPGTCTESLSPPGTCPAGCDAPPAGDSAPCCSWRRAPLQTRGSRRAPGSALLGRWAFPPLRTVTASGIRFSQAVCSLGPWGARWRVCTYTHTRGQGSPGGCAPLPESDPREAAGRDGSRRGSFCRLQDSRSREAPRLPTACCPPRPGTVHAWRPAERER